MYFTDRQLKILAFVHGYTQTHGIAPTLKEIASHFGVTKVTAHEHLCALERKQAIRRSRHQARSIELVNGPLTSKSPSTVLPIAGELGPGNELVYVKTPTEIDVADLVPTAKNGHVLRVTSDEFHDAGIARGDLLVIEPRSQIHDGELVLFALDRSRAVLGRYISEPKPQLLPLGGGTEPRPADPHRVRGVVQAVIRVLSDGAGRDASQRSSTSTT